MIKDTVVSQQVKGAEWVSLGVFNLTAGYNTSLLLQTTATNGYVIADAVRFSPVNNCDPIAVINNRVPVRFSLNVFPNPFNPYTTIKFELPVKEPGNTYDLNINMYDILGRKVWAYRDFKSAGNYSMIIDGSNLSSGVYFLVFEAGSYTSSQKIVLLK